MRNVRCWWCADDAATDRGLWQEILRRRVRAVAARLVQLEEISELPAEQRHESADEQRARIGRHLQRARDQRGEPEQNGGIDRDTRPIEKRIETGFALRPPAGGGDARV